MRLRQRRRFLRYARLRAKAYMRRNGRGYARCAEVVCVNMRTDSGFQVLRFDVRRDGPRAIGRIGRLRQ